MNRGSQPTRIARDPLNQGSGTTITNPQRGRNVFSNDALSPPSKSKFVKRSGLGTQRVPPKPPVLGKAAEGVENKVNVVTIE